MLPRMKGVASNAMPAPGAIAFNGDAGCVEIV